MDQALSKRLQSGQHFLGHEIIRALPHADVNVAGTPNDHQVGQAQVDQLAEALRAVSPRPTPR
jgi:hypothetical protein